MRIKHLQSLPILGTLFLCLFFVIPQQTKGQSFLQTHGKAIVNANGDTVILKGMGLGGWMLQEGYMLQTASFANPEYKIREKIEEVIGAANTAAFYDKWLDNHVRKIDIDSLKAWGFNSVRLPMHYKLFTLPIEEEPVAGEHTWLNKGFELTDSLVSWCKQNEMYVILDLHGAPGGQGMDEGISDYDPTKPSLWESQANRDKTVALWKKLAEAYVDEPWVAGYDLINETNWNLPGGTLLRNLYGQITDSIRSVDTSHIIFIEGNWFANDFTGLTPPWDDNLVYSPHKYWSINDQASIQWVLDIRDTYNVPLYFGETGENSNTWFRDAIKLFEEHELGWAWWPMKKVEAIAGPLSVIKPAGYQDLLNYWSGTGPMPSAQAANAALLQLAENLKIENCIYQKDVIDAMFRQVNDPSTIPFNTQSIPGVVYATDFDMGVAGSAYFDHDLANYHVSTGSYTAWNQGWAYRNDGVDIEVSEDVINSNGFAVGWLGAGEWMQYDIDVNAQAVYDVELRVAAGAPNGQFHLSVGDADISPVTSVDDTGGWQNWTTVTVRNVVLDPSDKKLKFHMDQAGFNLNSMKFIQRGASNSIPTTYLSAFTLDESTIQLNINKALVTNIPASPTDFQILVNGTAVPITQATVNSENTRIVNFSVDHNFLASELIQISYVGNQIQALDGTSLTAFSQQEVQNKIPNIYNVPGRVEAEGFFFQVGIQLETTTDKDGGQNIGFLDPGDYLDYNIHVSQAGTFDVAYRTAAESAVGAIQLELIDSSGVASILHSVSFPATGGWQTWATTHKSLQLAAGTHHIRLRITQPLFNINWFEFSSTTPIDVLSSISNLNLFPNPSTGLFTLEGNLENPQDAEIEVYNSFGQIIQTHSIKSISTLRMILDLNDHPLGHYMVAIRLEDGSLFTRKILKRR